MAYFADTYPRSGARRDFTRPISTTGTLFLSSDCLWEEVTDHDGSKQWRRSVQNVVHILAHGGWERLPDGSARRRITHKVSESRRGPLPGCTLPPLSLRLDRFSPRAGASVSFFPISTSSLPKSDHEHSTAIFNLNVKLSPIFDVALANTSDRVLGPRFLQPPLSHLRQ